jgi:hypothetical protein
VNKKYLRRFAMWMGLYAVMHIPMLMLIAVTESTLFGQAFRWIFVVLPLIPMFLGLRVFLNHLNLLDEYQHKIQLEAFAFSLGCICMLSFSYGMLEAFLGVMHISLIWIFPIAVYFWLAGAVLAKRKYQ